MIDDTGLPSSQQYDASFTSQFAAISECRITRASCYSWAQNLRYLAYYEDDHDLFQNACSEHQVTRKDDLTVFVEQGENLNSFFLNDEDACKFCRDCPKFPLHTKTTTFQLVQFGERGEETGYRPCADYLAVSYCWPKDNSGLPVPFRSTYSVVTTDSNGTRIRKPVGAPDEVIDRAVQCARTLNIRLIWLDQACLPQEQSEEHATGIQAMDMVYQQARISVGLIDRVRMTQAQLNAVALVMGRQPNSGFSAEPQDLIQPASPGAYEVAGDLLQFLEAFADDPFNNRAWILQEMLSAGRRAVLLFHHEDVAHYQGACNTLSIPQFNVPGVFNIRLWDIPPLISKAKQYLLSLRDSGFRPPLSTRVEEVMAKLELFHPQPSETPHWSSSFYMRGGSSYGPQRTCNAAVAMTYLSTRHNHDVADRLAILANICGYEIRLDILKVKKLCRSLATCVFALAFVNGDLSLFMPDVYSDPPVPSHVHASSQSEGGPQSRPRPETTADGPSWMVPFHQLVPSIFSDAPKETLSISLRNGNLYRVKDSRIMLPGCLWVVNRRLDLRPVRFHFRSVWESLERRQIRIPHRPGKSRKGSESQSQISKLEYTTPCSPSGDIKADDCSGQRTKYVVPGQYLDTDRAAQIKVALLLCHILAYLHYHLGETGAANSIWHCTRAVGASSESSQPSTEKTSDPIELPDTVEEALVVFGELPDLWKAFKFDLGPDGGFRQFWLVERIMRDGYLVASQHEDHLYPQIFDEPNSTEQSQTGTESVERWKSKTLERQLTLQVLTYSLLALRGSNPKDSNLATTNVGAVIDYIQHSARFKRGKAEDGRGERVSVFDVSEPCAVFVPLDRDLEILPRAHHRSMSHCWVVQPVGPADDRLQTVTRNDYNGLKAYLDGIQKLGSEFTEHEDPPSSSKCQEQKSHATTSETQESSEEKHPEPPTRDADSATSDKNAAISLEKRHEYPVMANLRVTGRVKGAWECIPTPALGYAFV